MSVEKDGVRPAVADRGPTKEDEMEYRQDDKTSHEWMRYEIDANARQEGTRIITPTMTLARILLDLTAPFLPLLPGACFLLGIGQEGKGPNCPSKWVRWRIK
ncbi:uncharacterized protein GLRG_11036 [Colletotrichum graminicola M1.001]|uniref:Uncharacterized protein n=1 Tax=Colletotrichum graminicola (strain M1.001 / M2 / FGSC 10212) TaxID=645133 RepID=E3QYJ0_COLGM|nr:uncharacterized protein GLRG_11036 [Colletotrichum graminicola M1.001]EFQ35928.1 hypothetical protein GLRG_11036 [Colletotrichum graminicola M1.001]